MKNRLRIVKTAIVISAVSGMALCQEPPVPPVPPLPPVLAMMQDAQDRPPRPPRPPRLPGSPDGHYDHSRSDRDYRSGQSALDRREYDRAIEAFNRVIAEKGSRADGALYWRAYAENRSGKRNEALATLSELQKTYAGSRWQEDAKALEVEVRQASGTAVSPENTSDEDMKLLVLNNMIASDPERIVPVLEKLLKSSSTPKVKERALFVLAQSRSTKARDLIGQVAKGNYNPDLQTKAVEYLGVFGGRDNAQTLTDVYKSTNDPQVKRAILHSFMISGNREALLSVAKGESNAELRTEAIRQLGVMGGSGELLQLYTPDAPLEVKRAVLQGLFIGGRGDKILEIARTDKDAAMRREAIRQLGPMGRGKAGDMAGLYAKESDPANRREILNALFVQHDVSGLIEIARKETDPGLKREAVQKLSIMGSKEANDFLLELLNK